MTLIALNLYCKSDKGNTSEKVMILFFFFFLTKSPAIIVSVKTEKWVLLETFSKTARRHFSHFCRTVSVRGSVPPVGGYGPMFKLGPGVRFEVTMSVGFRAAGRGIQGSCG